MNPQRLQFKERDVTKGIHITYSMADIPLNEYEKHVMRDGWFSVGFHYIIHPDGRAGGVVLGDRVEAGIPITQHADPSIEGWQDSICILLMGAPEGQSTALQRAAIDTIAREHNVAPVY